MHVTRDLGYEETILGLVLTAYGIGTVIGALIAASRGRRPVGPFLLGGTFLTGVLLFAISRTSRCPSCWASLSIAGIAQSVVLVTYLTARNNPHPMRSSAGSATARTISLGLQPIGMLAGGVLIDPSSGSTTIAVMGIGLIVLTLAFVPVRALRRATVMPATPP